MKTFLFCYSLALLLQINSASAQKSRPVFHSINAFGITVGQSGSEPLFQTVNGLAYDQWFSGIGFGANYYRYNSYPLFLDTRYYFNKAKKVLIYGNIGYNFPAKNKPEGDISYNNYKFSGGVYTDIGLGYRMKLSSKSAFLFTAGFNYKETQIKVGTVYPCFNGPCAVDYKNYHYGFGTVNLKAGIDF